jgi:hypothetical protein
MEYYLGVKKIKAEEMSRYDFAKLMKTDISKEDEAGYLVEYLDGGKPNHSDYANYISWSPKNVFEKAYRKIDGLTFGLAIEAMKAGEKVARKGWNGKNMWITLGAGVEQLESKFFWNEHTRAFAEKQPGGVAEVLPYFIMKTADDKILMGWLASQTDMTAEDWVVV